MNHTIEDKTMLYVKDSRGTTLGGSQEWYSEAWHRRAGCGPTTGSAIIWYLVGRHPELSALCDVGAKNKSDFIKLMDEMFTYITPGIRGVNSTVMFTQGIEAFGAQRGVPLKTNVLNIPPVPKGRVSAQELLSFLAQQLDADCPVAFLNLSNGTLKNLDNWHWVLIIGCDPQRGTVTICDQGASWDIKITQWLRSSVMGGGFVSVEPHNT